MKLNLTANDKTQELILAYLQENASETLAEKINSGGQIEKEGVRLISKKTLDGFMRYATDEAKKLADKGATSACVEDETVYGWAIHYFEEDTIEGTLYNEDGTEYKPPVKATPQPAVKPVEKPKAQNRQASLFDMLDLSAKQAPQDEPQKDDTDGDDEFPDEEPELPEEQTKIEIPQTEQPTKQGIPLYQSYMRVQEQYPDSIIAYRLGDFYEIFGDNAQLVADELDLTLTGRDCGLDERVPMVGFPYHASDMYFRRISEFHDVVIVDDDKTEILKRRKSIDRETGVITDTADITDTDDDPIDDPFSPSSFHRETMVKLYELLDGKMNLQ